MMSADANTATASNAHHPKPLPPPHARDAATDASDELSCSAFVRFARTQLRHAQQHLTRRHVLFFLKQHMPILEWLPSYDLREDLQYDLVAGVTVGMMIVPQEISLSTMMGVPPIYGLYTAALVPMIYPLFGTSRVLSVANGAEVSLLVGSAIKKIESVDERVATGILLSFLSGLLLLTMGVFRLGIIADFFSRPVMGGFISAGGVLIMLSQCANWFGVKVPNRDLPFLSVLDLLKESAHLNGNSFLLGLVSILILLGMRTLKRRVVREMARLEAALDDELEREGERVEDRRAAMDDAQNDSDDDATGDDDGESAYDDIELGDVGATTATTADDQVENKRSTGCRMYAKTPQARSGGVSFAGRGGGTPRLASARWQNIPSVRTTGSLRRSDLLMSPWAGARHDSDAFETMDARTSRQSDLSFLTRSTRHRLATSNSSSSIDEGVGFSLSDADYLSREQPREYAFMGRRTVGDDTTATILSRRAGFAPSLSRTTSESSLVARTPQTLATPRRRDDNGDNADDSALDAHTRDTAGADDQLPRFTRVKEMVSPAKSVASDTDSACSTTALNRSGEQSLDDHAFVSNSTAIRVIRSKIAVLIALRLVCELGAFTVCLVGGIIGYLTPKGDLVLTGDVPGGYPSPKLPWYGFLTNVIETDRLYHIIIDTLSIALISYMSSIAMAKRLAIKEGYRIRPNQELIALGFSNLVGSFFQAMPATGGLSRTAVNMQNARTQLASLITVGVVVIALYTATSVLAYLPKASLAAIIIVAGQSLIETKEARWLYRVKRDEFYVWLASFVLTVTLGVLPGLLSSIFASLVAVIYKTRRPMLTMLGEVVDAATGETRLVDLELYADTARPLSDIVVVRVEGALYFANCEYIERVIARELRKREQTEGVVVHGVVIDACSIMDWDSTTIQMMKHLQEDLSVRGIQLSIANARDRLHSLLESSDYLYGIVLHDSRIGFDEAIAAIRLHAVSPAMVREEETTTA